MSQSLRTDRGNGEFRGHHGRFVGRLTSITIATTVAWFPAVIGCSDGGPTPGASETTASDAALTGEDRVTVQVDISGEWATIHPRADGLKELLETMCDAEVGGDPGLDCSASLAPLSAYAGPIETTDDCLLAVCHMRGEICLGQSLEEMARSPVPREAHLSLTAEIIAAFDLPPSEASLLNTAAPYDFRFGPELGAARAAALRVGVGAYVEAVRAASEAFSSTVAPQLTCAAFLTGATVRYPATQRPWFDVYEGAFIDASSRVTELVRTTAIETRNATMTKSLGYDTPSEQSVKRWNQGMNSFVGLGRIFGTGRLQATPQYNPIPLASYDGADKFDMVFNSNQLPACPPVEGSIGVQRAIKLARSAGVSVLKPKTKVPNGQAQTAPFVTALVDAYVEDKAIRGELAAPPASTDEVLSELGFTQADAELAEEYLRAEAAMFGRTQIERADVDQPVAPSGFTHVPRSFGTHEPEPGLPDGVVASQMLGAMEDGWNGVAPDPDSPSSLGAGVFRALDHTRWLAHKLGLQFPSATLAPALGDLEKVLSADVGDMRVSIAVDGVESEGAGVDAITVWVYGVDTEADYFVVQGLPELKCLLYGAVDGAPCNTVGVGVKAATGPGSPYDDLPSNGAVRLETTALPNLDLSRPLNPAVSGPIRNGETVYVVERKNGAYKVLGGTNAIVSESSPYKANIHPAGGLMFSEMDGWLAAHPKDCSEPVDSCVGLSTRLVPPLESEIVGDPTGQSGEDSWKYFLESAKSMADEADRLGEDLLATGLEIDRAKSDADQKQMDLCGADGRGCSDFGDDYVVLGDGPACVWILGNQICGQPQGATIYQHCPFVPDDSKTCDQMIGAPLPTGAEWVNVVPLGSVKGDGGPSNDIAESCADFNELRKPGLTAKERDALVRAIAGTWTKEKLLDIAKGIHYTEHFGDNYELTYGTEVVFDTRRRSVRTAPAAALAPCVSPQNPTADDSGFWSSKVDCFGTPEDCSSTVGVGRDGCTFSGATSNAYSLDTEYDALRNRWAWGFGHLRRSVAALGLITGELDQKMSLAFVVTQAWRKGDMNPPGHMWWEFNTSLGNCRYQGLGGEFADDPTWLWRCDSALPGPEKTVCVLPADDGTLRDVNGDPLRHLAGRPVNANAFIGNWVYSEEPYLPAPFVGGLGFPGVCDNDVSASECNKNSRFLGVDPQMVYCWIPNQYGDDLSAWNGVTTLTPQQGSSAWVGATHHADLRVNPSNEAWAIALKNMWAPPHGTPCSAATDDGSIWVALCHEPGHDTLTQLKGNEDFMRKGVVPGDGEAFVHGDTTGAWLTPLPFDGYSQGVANAIYDTRTLPVWAFPDGYVKLNLQYELTPQNVLDAMELACHVSRMQRRPKVVCDQLLGAAPQDDDIATYLSCLSASYRAIGERHVTGPVPAPVIEAFMDGAPISSMSGLGGAYLDGMVAERDALEGIGRQFAALSDAIARHAHFQFQATNEKARLLAALGSIDCDLLAKTSRDFAGALTAAAEASGGLAALASGGTANMAHAWSSAFQLAAAAADARAADYDRELQQLQDQLELARILGGMRDNARAARDAATQLVVEFDNLTAAAAKVRLIKAQADRNGAMGDLADYWDCGADDCAIPYNTAMRRTYNTRLLRYESALKRAKQAAFVARRAIEVRFGVALPRMTRDMSFVEAPQKWADSVCTMQGINYADIRTADADGGVQQINFDTPAAGDDFADAYIGDYVRKLEDFVRSYPFDYPLKESDDTAVLSLKDHILGLTSSCSEPSYNLLRYSSLLSEPSAWDVQGCDAAPTTPSGKEWNDCVQALPRFGADDGGSFGELPAGSDIHLLRNAACTPAQSGIPDGIAKECPDQTTYMANGSLGQTFTTESYASYWATAYFRNVSAQATAHPLLRVIDPAVTDQNARVVEQTPCTVGATWTRCSLAFSASEGRTLRFEILPSSDPALELDSGHPALWPAVLVAAAQVEAAGVAADNQPEPPREFQATNQTRLVPGQVCNEASGADLRREFVRSCQKTCSEGIKDHCKDAAEDAAAASVCFYETTFDIPIESIESGQLLPGSQIAAGNFNYRHNTFAVNLVGTGVADCATMPTQSCYANGFAEFTLLHDTTGVTNWEGSTLDVAMPTARIEHGKALAAERLITNPPSSTDLQLLEPYTKLELRGRPLHGRYKLRVWESPQLAWDRVDDIQLVWRYHYWTRFSK